jgi:WD40 repeat protein
MAVIEVAIAPGGIPGKVRVEVIGSPAGRPSTVVGLDAASLTARRALLQLEVVASATRGARETEQLLRAAGQALFAGLLGADGIVDCYRASAALAAERGEQLRVLLRIDDAALAELPWEAMFDHEAGEYICRRDQLVRHVAVAPAAAPPRICPPLRILGVVSSSENLNRIDANAEKEHLTRALVGPVNQGLAEVHWAQDATWGGLQDLLVDGKWHVLHYIGHGGFDPDRDEGVLAMEREGGWADLVPASRLVDLLRQARPMPRLVVLSSCIGSATGARDQFSRTAAALVRGGVPAVTAIQYKISDNAAIAFARALYSAIARGRGVDDAVSGGRAAILGTSDHTLEWVSPVLYLGGHRARLFTVPAPFGSDSTDAAANRGDLPVELAAEAPVPTAPSWRDRTLTGHAGEITTVAFSPGGQLIATASRDATVRVWDTASGRCLHVITGHTGTDLLASRVAFSPDGRLIATANRGVPTRVWDAATGRCVLVLTDMAGPAAFSPDGRVFAIAGDQATAQMWDTTTGRRLNVLTGHLHILVEDISPDMSVFGKVEDVAFSPDGRLIATASWDQTARVWDVATGRCLHVLIGHGNQVQGVKFSPDGRLIATSGWDAMVRVWDTDTGRCLQVLTGGASGVPQMAFSPDGRLIATVDQHPPRIFAPGWDERVRVWDVASGCCLRVLTGHAHRVGQVAFSPDGRLIATVDTSLPFANAVRAVTARVWDLLTGQCLHARAIGSAWDVAFSPDGQLLATASSDKTSWPGSGANLLLSVTVVPPSGSEPWIGR